MVKPAYLLGVLALVAAAGGIALQDRASDPVIVAAPIPTTTPTPVPTIPSPAAPRSTKAPALTRDQLYVAGRVASVSCPLPGGSLNTNQTIYFLWKDLLQQEIGDRVETQMAMLQLMTHEYGHHLQLIFGIDNYYGIRYDDTHGDPTLIESRRMELQATCLGAAFLGANRASLRLRGQRLEELNYYLRTGDEPDGPHDHGSDKSNELWTRAAFKSMNPASCNTWTAPAARVS